MKHCTAIELFIHLFKTTCLLLGALLVLFCIPGLCLGQSLEEAKRLNKQVIQLYKQGRYQETIPLVKRALAIREKALGPDHPDVANSLNNLAMLYYSLGDYAKAEPLYKRSLAIREKALGPDHPDVANSLNNLAVFYTSRNEYNKAHSLSMRGQAIDEKLIDQVSGFTSEDRQLKFLSTTQSRLALSLSLVIQHLRKDESARIDALNVWLRRKGVLLEAQRRFQEALIYSDDLDAVKTFQELSRVRTQLSKLAFAGPGKEGPEAYKKKLAGLEAEKEILEARLSKISRAFAIKQKVSKANCRTTAAALPKNTALIEFANINMFNFKAKDKEKTWNPPHYLAFVLYSGTGSNVGLIDLGDAGKIDKAVKEYKKRISTGGLSENELKTASKNIYDLVFKPIKEELGEIKEVFISPDGNLNLIPFEVLQGPDGRYLIEDYTFNYLSAGRDIIGFGQIESKGEKALFIGDPDFDMGADKKDTVLRKLALINARGKDTAKRSTDMKGLFFTRLPGTGEEVKTIHALFGQDKAELYTGKEALEEVIKSKKTPSILHLATHGFFLDDLDLSSLRDDRGLKEISVPLKPSGKRVKIENPLLRSGIALAGANNSLKHGDLEKNDWIVTAEKILGLRLRGTDMVVLSACETGLGEVKAGEGVYGLRRAFTQAGAGSLVMSLWSVPDRETRELMVAF